MDAPPIAREKITWKTEPSPTRDMNRDSGTDRANGGWLRRLLRRIQVWLCHKVQNEEMDWIVAARL
jgi:hypothetical protein